jgi:hypothetical protein
MKFKTWNTKKWAVCIGWDPAWRVARMGPMRTSAGGWYCFVMLGPVSLTLIRWGRRAPTD